jgi:hypothetical protein
MKRDDRGHRGSTGLATRFARRLAAAILILALVGTAGVAPAGDNLLVGTWKLKSFVREDVASGERKPALGEHPEGYLGYGLDGRMYALFVAGGRVVPAGDQPTDAERAQLHKSVSPMAGRTRSPATRSSITSILLGTTRASDPTRSGSSISTARS